MGPYFPWAALGLESHASSAVLRSALVAKTLANGEVGGQSPPVLGTHIVCERRLPSVSHP
eukprot:scaffold130622_cov54-Phaeocystis_antarctica.AAC.3